MKKSFFYFVVTLSILVLAARFGLKPASELLGYQSKAGVKITSVPEAMVSIEGVAAGKTPYQNEDLKPGNYKIKIEESGAFWEGTVSLTSGTLSIINREIAPSVASSSGEILTLYPGKGAVIASSPPGSEVEIDGRVYGKTPLSVSDLTPGDHTFVLSHSSYLKRSIRASLPPKMSLHIAVDLAISEINLTVPAAPVVSSSLVIKQTPTGFLRVREKPSLNAKEVGRVAPGDTVTLVEELSGWVKIKLENDIEGYVSSQYVQKQP